MTRTAIVSMSCLFPGATSPDQFWSALVGGHDLRSELASLPEVGPESQQHRLRTRRGGFVDAPPLRLDGLALGADLLAGLDRAFTWPIHVVREALEQLPGLDRSRTGLVLGNYTFPTPSSRAVVDGQWYAAVADGLRDAGLDEALLPPLLADPERAAGSPLELAPGGMPARVAALALGLGGPAYCLDAACASSLYAMDLAVRRLAAGEVDVMVAGGVCVPDEELIHLCFSDLQAYPTDDRSQPFDTTSRGILTGQGAAVVVLKRLEDARRDGDEVLAVVEGVGLSNDGRGRHLLAPSREGQVRAYADAYAKAGVQPGAIDYVECHATGTPLGDRTELDGLAEFFVEGHGAAPLHGTVKPNVSHLLTVAGMSSLFKVVLAMRHGTIPPTIGVEEPMVDPRLPDRLVREARPWPASPGSRRAGISSFGFGGTNAHLVVSDDTAPRNEPVAAPSPRPRLAVEGIGLALAGAEDAVAALRRAQRTGRPLASPSTDARLRGLGEGDVDDRAFGDFPADALGMRIPPNDLRDFNTQHLALMNAARDCLLDVGLEPDAPGPRRVAVVVVADMELDAHGHGARFRLGEHLEAGLRAAGVPEAEVEQVVAAAREGIHDGLSANEVLSYIGNLMASRISARWNLIGPAFTVAGDATAAVDALEVAGDLLRGGDVDGVLVGGVDLAVTAAALAGGRRTHDVGAADGAACLFLTDASRATAARRYAVIDAVGRDDDPAGAARAALAAAGARADEVGLVDLPPGDRGELLAPVLGSATAGVASTGTLLGDSRLALPFTALAAAALSCYDATLPATPAPLLGDGIAVPSGLVVGTQSQPWLRRAPDHGRRSLVSLRGHTVVGRTASAAVVLSGADLRGDQPEDRAWGSTDVPRLVPVRAADPAGLACAAGELAAALAQGRTTVADALRTGLQADGARTLVVVGRDDAEVVAELERAAAGLEAQLAQGRDWVTPSGSCLPVDPVGDGRVAFVFPGAFNSYVGLGQDLFDAFPVLAGAFERSTPRPAEVLRADGLHPRGTAPLERRDLMCLDSELLADIPFMLGSGTSTSLLHTIVLQDVLGVRADGAFGYSLGESSMMFAMGGWHPDARDDGRISGTDLFRDGLTGRMDVVRRAWGLEHDPGAVWTTMVVLVDVEAARSEVARHERAFLTHVNAPGEVVVAGHPQAVAAVIEALGARAARAPANHVMHVPVVDPVLDELAELNRYPTQPVGVELLSAFDYQPVPVLGAEGDDALVAGRIAHTLRSTIDFPRLVEAAYDRGYRYFVEAGPGGTCTRWVGEILGARPHAAVAMDRRGVPAARTVAGVAARLLAHGLPVDLEALARRLEPASARPSIPVPCGGPPVRAAVAAACGDLSAIRPTVRPEPHHPEEPTVTRSAPSPLRRTSASQAIPWPSTTVQPPAAVPGAVPSAAPVAAPVGSVPRVPSTAGPDRPPVPPGRAEPPAAPCGPAWSADDVERAVSVLRAELADSEAFLARISAGLPPAAVAPTAAPADPPTDSPAAQPADQVDVRRPRREGVVFDERDLTAFAEGSIADAFGPDYAEIDTFARRVRLPAEPYHFVSRVTALDARLGERGSASITTEYDVPVDAWYLTDGQVPPAVTIEAGQCDLLLASYLGIDLDNRGERVYRLLDSSLTFHGDLPRGGQTLRYEITIDRFVHTPGPTLFFFRYLGYADDELCVELTDGCAGFFTDEELEASIGVVKPPVAADEPQRSFRPLARTARTSLGPDDVRALSGGDAAGVFGPEHDQGAGDDGRAVNPSVRLAPQDLLMVDHVDELSFTGGAFGLGRVVARKSLQPDAWYFTSHFTDDPVLPGSLVAEGAVQLLQTYAMGAGLHLVFPDARFQPVRGVTTKVQVRGQMLPRHRELRYEVDVKEVALLPRPHVVADVTVHVEGKASVSIVDLAIAVAEKPGTAHAPGAGGVVDTFLGRRNRDGEPALLNEFHMAHAAKGDLAVAMGPEFGVYAGRRAPYIPNGDFLFVDRVMAIEGTRGELRPGAVMETEYDVPHDAWYLDANGGPVVPHCVLLESSLQSAILLGYYLGATLAFPEEGFRIRNLDGTAQVTRTVDLRGKTVRQRSVLLASIPMPGTVLQKFSYELSTDGEVFYRGESMFGYFNDGALAHQLGLDNGQYVPPWLEDPDGAGSAVEPLGRTPGDYAGRRPALASDNLQVAGSVDLVVDGGSEGLGYVFGERDIEVDDWYFRCHFHADPVMPGSLGIEAMISALQVLALEKGLGASIPDPVFAPAVDVPLTWRYRGQIPHAAMEMSYELHVTDVRTEPDRVVVVARGSLWRPGLRIYDVEGLAIEIRTTPTDVPGGQA